MAATRPLLIYDAKVNGSIFQICPWQNERQWSGNDVLLSIMVTLHGDWSQRFIYNVLVTFIGNRQINTHPAQSETEGQPSVNDFWSCKSGSLSETWPF